MTALLPTGLFTTALCLGAVVVYQAAMPVPPIKEMPVRAAAPELAPRLALATYQPPSEEEFAIINARPVFDPARQPVTEPRESGPRSASPPDVSLVGIAIGSRKSVALLKKADGRTAISAQLGDTVDGWQLVRIEPGFVVFHANATDYTVKLRAAAGLPQPVLNGAAPPPVVTGQPGR